MQSHGELVYDLKLQLSNVIQSEQELKIEVGQLKAENYCLNANIAVLGAKLKIQRDEGERQHSQYQNSVQELIHVDKSKVHEIETLRAELKESLSRELELKQKVSTHLQ